MELVPNTRGSSGVQLPGDQSLPAPRRADRRVAHVPLRGLGGAGLPRHRQLVTKSDERRNWSEKGAEAALAWINQKKSGSGGSPHSCISRPIAIRQRLRPRPGWPSCLPCPFIRGGNAEAGRHRESGSSASHLIMAADKRTEIQVAPGSAHLLRIVGGAKNDRRSKSGFGWHIPATQWRFPHREVGPLQQLPGGHKVLYGYAVTHKGR